MELLLTLLMAFSMNGIQEVGMIKNESPCIMVRKEKISFSSSITKDTATASVTGPSCADAIYKIDIHRADGKLIYHFESPATNMYSMWRGQDPQAEKLLVYPLKTGKTQSLPLIKPNQVPDECGHSVIVSFDQYDRFRKENLRYLNHATYHEGDGYVVYDSKKGKAVMILAGGC